MIEMNKELELASNYIKFTNKNIFLTGKAGTGKTTFLKSLHSITSKRFVVVAPTGVAAINAGGVTIHSFFQLNFGPQLPEEHTPLQKGNFPGAKSNQANYLRFRKEKIKLIRSLDLLVIDEISMVRADLLDGIDRVLRRFRAAHKPFGGVQLLLIGDIQQLAPVAREEEWKLLRDYYDSVYFFSSKALKAADYITLEIKHIYRQQDEYFIEMLNAIRENKTDSTTISSLNKRYNPNFSPPESENYITLTTHNLQADRINQQKLMELPSELWTYRAEISGDFPAMAFPTEENLSLKIGSQVMFVKNDPSHEKLFYNGKIGRLIGRDQDILLVKCQDEVISVGPLLWQNRKYQINEENHEIEEQIVGSFTQYPLRLAWAITIHKSQGLTFSKVIIDAASAFAHGQVYVALSRCTHLEGIVLKTPINSTGVERDLVVYQFLETTKEKEVNSDTLEKEKKEYEWNLMTELIDFKEIKYQLTFLSKFVNENRNSFPPNYLPLLVSMHQFAMNMDQISQKFQPQLQKLHQAHPILDQNQALQERIAQAAQYFHNQLKENILPSSLEADIDNKEIQKRHQSYVDKIDELLQIKRGTLAFVEKGFSIEAYLKTRNQLLFGDKPKEKGNKKDRNFETGKNQNLYRILKEWRDWKAEEEEVEVYRIITVASMNEIAGRLPRNLSQLTQIKGFGKKKVKVYGKEIIEMVSKYAVENNLEPLGFSTDKDSVSVKRQVKHPARDSDPKPKTPSSLEQSLMLAEQGHSMAEIAAIREFAISTIEGHLVHWIERGQLKADKFVAKEKIQTIKEYFQSANNLLLNPAKETLGEDYSYSELKLVRSELLSNENQNKE